MPGRDREVEKHEGQYWNVGLCTCVDGSDGIGGNSVAVDGTDSVGGGGGVGSGCGDSGSAGSAGGS